MTEDAPRRDTPATLRGTALHAASEAIIRLGAGMTTDEEFEAEKSLWLEAWSDTVDWDEAADEVSVYVDEVLSRFEEGGQLFLERRVTPPVQDCWGTSDAIVLSPSGAHLHVLDLKTGRIQVSPERNPQAMLYASGALAALSPIERARVQRVTLTIVQSPVREVRDWTVAPWEIDHEVGRLAAAADLTRDPAAPCVPGEVQCQWCPAKGKCAAFSRWNVERFFGPVTRPLPEVETLSDADLVTMLRRAQAAKEWVAALSQEAAERSGGRPSPIPGLRVKKVTRRKIKDPADAVARLAEAGYTQDMVTETKPLGLTRLTKLVGGSDRLDLILGEALSHETTTSVVPD